MLHEVLLALGGNPGSIFQIDERGQIKVCPDLPFISPAEVVLLNRLCKLATFYVKFTTFIKIYRHAPTTGEVAKGMGLYRRALCEGLLQVLGPYRCKLLEVEKELLADPHLTATHVQDRLEQFQLLFPSLGSVLDQIEQQEAHGCHILEILYKASASGCPIVRQAILRILYICHGVLYKQLAGWLLHGMLQDRYSEFFIHKMPRGTQSETSSQEEEDQLGLGGITTKQLLHALGEGTDNYLGDQTYSHAIRAEMLPTYIPLRIAEKILFVGESVEMFENNSLRVQHKQKGLINPEREDVFAQELLKLSRQPEFNLMAFEGVMDGIRAYVAEQLWRLVVEDADLLSHLRVMKDFFLLGRGELFLAFIDQAQNLLRVPPTATTQHDVNMAFQQAARNVLLEDDHLLQKFRFIIPLANQKRPLKDGANGSTSAGESGWQVLQLAYTAEWPLHILFTEAVLDRYNTLFAFLLFVKRIQLELQQCWALQMQRCHHQGDESNVNKWWLRNHMAFLIDNLQYYLQVDVIESQFSILQDKIHSTHDFEAIRHAHETFITSLLAQSFLLSKPIAHCLNEILEQCHCFCGLVSQTERDLTERESAQLDTITKNFQRQSNLLFKILSSVRGQSSPHLAQLLLRIDFNKYFTISGGQLGSTHPGALDTRIPSSSRH